MKPFSRFSITLMAAGAIALPLPTLVHAQAPVGGVVTFVVPAGGFGSSRFTDVIVGSLSAASKFCGALDSAYRVDCLAERIGKMAADIPEDTDYEEIKDVLNQTSQDMANLARRNRDSSKPRQNVSTGGSSPQATTRPLTAVRADSQASVNQQAEAILQNTETLLLRTPDDDTGKKLHYTRIAEAIGSNKTLLRST